MSAADLTASRLHLGAAAVLSPAKAAELLPFRESDALRWMRENGLVRQIPGLGEAVIWGEVVAAIQGPPSPPPPSRRGRLPRSSL